jgi:hypothetical protein
MSKNSAFSQNDPFGTPKHNGPFTAFLHLIQKLAEKKRTKVKVTYTQ